MSIGATRALNSGDGLFYKRNRDYGLKTLFSKKNIGKLPIIL